MNPEGSAFRGRPLDARRLEAVAAILAGERRGEIARRLGITERVLRKWAASPTFVAELNRQRNALRDQLVARVAALAEAAVEALQVSLPTSPRTALDLLTRLGVIQPLGVGPEDPAEIAADLEAREALGRLPINERTDEEEDGEEAALGE